LIGKSWKSIKGRNEKEFEFMKTKKATMSWPDDFKMSSFAGEKRDLVLEYMCPLEQIAFKLVDPEIMFKNRDAISLEAEVMYAKDESGIIDVNERIITNLMTSDLAIETQQAIRSREGCSKSIIIPMPAYSDGVSVGGLKNVTQIAAMGTMGNMHLSLLKKRISKISIGYVPQLSSFVSIPDLIAHLQSIGYSKTAAAYHVKYFEMELIRFFWKSALYSLTRAYVEGVSMYALGHGVVTVHPFVPYVTADGPGAQDMTNIMRNSCLNCPWVSGKLDCEYDEETYPERDPTVIMDLCVKAEKYVKLLRTQQKSPPKQEPKIGLDENASAFYALKNMGIKPIVCVWNYIAMGVNNSVYKAMLDILHAILGGLIRSTLSWTLRVEKALSTTSTDPLYKKADTQLDRTIVRFPRMPPQQHMQWTHFDKGLMHIVENDSKQDKGSSTGKGGGYKTADMLPALIQVFFAIVGDENYKLLPSDATYEFTFRKKKEKTNVVPKTRTKPSKKGQFAASTVVAVRRKREEKSLEEASKTGTIKLGNVRRIVLEAISDCLHFYFEIMREEMSLTVIDDINQLYKRVLLTHKRLFSLKEIFVLNHGGLYESARKYHGPVHLKIKQFAVPSTHCTGSYENFHGFGTSTNWDQTSGRKISRNTEMIGYLKRFVYLHHYRNGKDLLSGAKDLLSTSDKVEEMDSTEFSTVMNVKSYSFKLVVAEASSRRSLSLKQQAPRVVSIQLEREVHEKDAFGIGAFVVSADFVSLLNKKDNADLLDNYFLSAKTTRFIQKLSVSNFGSTWGKDFYRVNEFVVVLVAANEEGATPIHLIAQILGMIEVCKDDGDSDSFEYLFILRYLAPKSKSYSKHKNAYEFYDTLEYSKENDKIQIEHQSAINGPAFVVTTTNEKTNAKTFFYVPRAFFDRSGWSRYGPDANTEVPPSLSSDDALGGGGATRASSSHDDNSVLQEDIPQAILDEFFRTHHEEDAEREDTMLGPGEDEDDKTVWEDEEDADEEQGNDDADEFDDDEDEDMISSSHQTRQQHQHQQPVMKRGRRV